MNKAKMNALLIRVKQGDNDAFAQLYNQTKKGIYAFLYTYYNNVWDTENAMQSTYLRVKQYAHTYTENTDARAWLFQIAKNFALNELKKQKRETVVDESTLVSVGGKTETPTGEVFEALNKALDETEKQIVILHVLWGYKHREIAVELQMPLGTVLSKYNVSVKKLREYLIKGDNANV